VSSTKGIGSGTARVRRIALTFAAALIAGTTAAVAAEGETTVAANVQDLSRLSIEELANVEITSVARRPQPLSQAPAAVFVITNDDVHRTGAVDITEALRLAPNLQVARIDASNYGITARGFNHATGTANKLLVMIDGRTVYSPLFSGVFWDAQNVLLEDLDRIEVISGPGGTLWGANAVNGIINIVTRSSAETQGVLVDLREGFVDRSASFRFGGRLNESTTYRVYAFGFERDHSLRTNGDDASDDWENVQGGFRLDWSEGADEVTVQGDIYHGTLEDMPGQADQAAIGGGNLLARWSRDLGAESSVTVQVYYDTAWRDVASGIRASVDTYDVDVQYRFPLGAHDVVVGGGYRSADDTFEPAPGTSFLDPSSRTLERENVFAQDSLALSDTLRLTFGLKIENNSYTGVEFMPDARLAWQVSDTALLWAAASRAVRTPSRVDRDLFITGTFAGGPSFDSENVIAYELGYRGQPLPSLSLSVSAFYNVYDDLRTVEASSLATFPLVVRNGMEGSGYGVEAWGTYEVSSWWRLSAGVSAMHKDLKLKPGNQDVVGLAFAGNDPDYQVNLRSSMNFGPDFTFDVFARHIADLPSPPVDAYTEINARLGWQVTDSLELAVTGSDLVDPSHQEFASPSLPRREVRRSVYFSAVWKS
jgi:iron complex outermembrane recepter protein